MKTNRYLEIAADGLAFHETDFGGNVPPTEVFYCDCEGAGKITWNPDNMPHVGVQGDPDAVCAHCAQPYGHLSHTRDGLVGHVFVPNETRPMTLEEWQARHKECGFRRQIFVDVTHRPAAQLGMVYDEKTDTFSKV